MRKAFEGVFGNTAELRLLEFLLPLEGLSFNLSELAEEAEVSRPTVQKVVEKFVKHGIMKISESRGNTRFYEINPISPFVILFEEINNLLIEEMLDADTLMEIRLHWESRRPNLVPEPITAEAAPELKNPFLEEESEPRKTLFPEENLIFSVLSRNYLGGDFNAA